MRAALSSTTSFSKCSACCMIFARDSSMSWKTPKEGRTVLTYYSPSAPQEAKRFGEEADGGVDLLQDSSWVR